MTWPLTAGRSPRLLTGMQPCPVRLGGRPRRTERGELAVPERGDDAPARQIRLPVVFRLGGGPGLTNMRFGCPPALQPQATTQLVGGLLATGTVDAHFDTAIPPLKLTLRLPTAARLAGGGLLAAAGASALTATTWWKRRHHCQLSRGPSAGGCAVIAKN